MTAPAVDAAPAAGYVAPNLGCAGCGHCCEEIHLQDEDRNKLAAWGAAIAAGMLPDPNDDDNWRSVWLAGRATVTSGDGLQTITLRFADEHRARACSTWGNAAWMLTGKWQPLPPPAPAGLAGLTEQMFGTMYRCTVYDAKHHRCGDHANRPPICRLAPWYDEDPATAAAQHLPYPQVAGDFPTGAPLACSYHLDVPPALRGQARPLIPLKVVKR